MRGLMCETASGDSGMRKSRRHRLSFDLDRLRLLAPQRSRGSMSKTIACDVIAELGELHYGRKRVQPSAREVTEFHERARDVLKYPLLDFKVSDFAVIADGLVDAIREHDYTCYASADHAGPRSHHRSANISIEPKRCSTICRSPAACGFAAWGWEPTTIPSGAAPVGRSSSTPRLTSAGQFTILSKIR